MIAKKYYESRKEIIEEGLKTYLTPNGKYPERLHEAINYAVFSEGKRLRPMLLFATYEMLKEKKNLRSLQKLVPLAVALELVHTAHQVHHDLPSIANKYERRGKYSVHKKYDEPTALLVGDALFTKAFEVLSDFKEKNKIMECLEVLSRAASTRGFIGGEVVEILSKLKKVRLNVVRYIHLKKSGSLLQAAVELACIIDGTEENLSIMLGNFALNIGLAHQITEELLDEFGTFDEYARGSSQEGSSSKLTYPYIIGSEKAKKIVIKLLRDSYNIIKPLKNNNIHMDLINAIKEKIPE